MLKPLLKLVIFSLIATSLISCSGGERNGSLEIRNDLTLQSIGVEAVAIDPAFTSANFGLYEGTVSNDVESVTINVGELTEASSDVEVLVFRKVIATRDNLRGQEDLAEISPGTAVEMPIVEGDNVITVRVQTTDAEQRLDYSYRIRRTSSVADIRFINFAAVSDLDVAFESPSSFDPAVTEYTLSAPYGLCSVFTSVFLQDREATLTFNGEDIDSGAGQYIDLAVGENTLEYAVTPELGGEAKVYTFTVTRDEPTQDDLDADVTLSQLTLAGVELEGSANLEDGFNCLFRSYDARVTNEQSVVTLSAAATVATRTVRAGPAQRLDTDEDGVDEFILGDLTELAPGATLDFDLEVEQDNFIAISLGNDDNDEPITHYIINVFRSESTLVLVNTGEELQQALQAAQPGEQIVISDRFESLSASSSAAASGKEGVMFYSAASGTADEPIVLLSESFIILSPLEGEASATALELEGDYWQVQDLQIRDMAKGIVLNGASNNNFRNVFMNDIGETGLSVKNGSNNNSFARFIIDGVSGDGIVVGSDATQWVGSPSGTDEPINDANQFGNVVVGPSVSGSLLKIEEGAQNTSVLSAAFFSDGSQGIPDSGALVEVQGNDSTLSLLNFSYTGSEALSSVIRVLDVDQAWVTDAWGEGNEVSSSRFDLQGAINTPLVAADASVDNVIVANNARDDGETVSYSGAAIVEREGAQVYQLQWFDEVSYNADTDTVEEHTYCLTRGSIDSILQVGQTFASSELDAMVAASCDVADANQHWRFTLNTDGFSVLNSVADGAFVAPRFQGALAVAGADAITFFAEADVSNVSDSYLRWILNATGDGKYYITNGFARGHAITMSGSRTIVYSSLELSDYFVNGYMAFGAVYLGDQSQQFTLVPVE